MGWSFMFCGISTLVDDTYVLYISFVTEWFLGNILKESEFIGSIKLNVLK